ncbi:MAG: DNA repair protein RecN [Pseudarcicella sp.]|nr:DNA repair protein RecN [Pseudarcicella sp.]
MLRRLQVKNYVLIDHLIFEPNKGLNIITGETGAGKSVLLGALGLLMGNRADTKSLFNENEKCVIEGEFDLSKHLLNDIFEAEDIDYDQHCIVRREISPQGKSRAFINDTPVNLETLKKISFHLMDVHSQNDTLLLGSNAFQLEIIDAFAQNKKLIEKYKSAFKEYSQKKKAYDLLLEEAKENKKEYDFNLYLFEELSKEKIQPNQLSGIEQELNLLENAEELKRKLSFANEYFNHPEESVIAQLRNALSNLQSISKFSPAYLELKNRLESCIIELKDIADEVESEEEKLEIDNAKADFLRERVGVVYALFQKHHVNSEAELLKIQHDLDEKINRVANFEHLLEQSLQTKTIAQENLLLCAQQLSTSRKAVLKDIESQIADLLQDLQMTNAKFCIEINETTVSEFGSDAINFLFSANKGGQLQSLKNVASGGEFSRLMLVIKYILASKRALPTIIFDEIDTGVSGEVSIKIGKMMREMAKEHQLITITHLHQIAAQGNEHYFVYKDEKSDKTTTNIKKLDNEQRVSEIAEMIGGKNPSQAVIENAREILAQK